MHHEDSSSREYLRLATTSEANASNLESDHQRIVHDFEIDSSIQYGLRTRKSRIDILDLLAVVTSILSFIAGVMVVSPYFHYAVKLGYPGQIIAVGLLLGIMNQCLQRIIPYLFILIEARYGSGTLQNYEGLLRWSPFIRNFNLVWKTVLVLLLVLPLALGILYKSFSGGHASTKISPSTNATYGPTGPPGMQDNISGPIIVANATAPFLSTTRDDNKLPSDHFQRSHVYGFNVVLLSNTSAASLDAPVPSRITALQQKLKELESIALRATVRGTVVRYNSTVDAHRHDKDYWDVFHKLRGADGDDRIDEIPNSHPDSPGYSFAILHKGEAGNDVPEQWDGSWIYIASFDNALQIGDKYKVSDMFDKTAIRFDARRHQCEATWRITRGSVELESATCNSDELPARHQYYSNAQISMRYQYLQLLAQTLGDFAISRKQSQWLIPTHTVLLSSVYQGHIAARKGEVPIQIDGPIFLANKVKFGDKYIETYTSNEELILYAATLYATPGLYFILAIQPILTLLAYCASVALYHVPIARTFGLVSILAGIKKKSLGLLAGAEFSGQLDRPVALKIEVVEEPPSDDAQSNRRSISYDIGMSGVSGRVRPRRIYG